MAKASQPDMFSGMEKSEPPAPTVVEAQSIWNEFAEKNSWTKCLVLDKARRQTIGRALGDYGGIIGWRKAIETVERSRFVMGKVPPREGTRFKQFKASIDWFCQAKTVRQVFEGFWEDDGGQDGIAQPGKSSLQQQLKKIIDWDKKLAAYKPGNGFWHVDSMGPRPEDPGPHKIPADKLAAWRDKHRIGERKQETLAERLASSIATYRRLGDWARANAAEEKLAALEGRAPVLVPAPDARDPDVVPNTASSFERRYPKAPEYREAWQPRGGRSEAAQTAALAAAQDIPWTEIPEGDESHVED